jgi:hypothetical protein
LAARRAVVTAALNPANVLLSELVGTRHTARRKMYDVTICTIW